MRQGLPTLGDGAPVPLDDAELSRGPVRYLDWHHDTWAELAVAPYVSPFAAGRPVLKEA